MAFEPSEGLYAGLSFVSTADLNIAKTDTGKFKELYFIALENLKSDKVLDAAGNATKNGMIKIIDFNTTSKNEKDIYSDLAASISAVLGTRSKLKKDKIPSKVYLTGNRWHPDVEQFKVKAFGMSDYNSSDVNLRLNHNDYVGVSLKKKHVTVIKRNHNKTVKPESRIFCFLPFVFVQTKTLILIFMKRTLNLSK